MLDLLIIAICLAFNAFFSAYEMAFVTVSMEDLNNIENQKVRKQVLKFKKKPERTLSAIQIGITMVGAIAAAVGGTGAVESLEPFLVENLGISARIAEALAVGSIIIPLTYLSVVLGELVPKSISIKRPLSVIGFGTSILHLFDRFLSPVVSFLEISTAFLLEKLNLLSKEEEVESDHIDVGSLAQFHRQFVLNLVGLKGRKVERAFIPKDKVAYIDFSDSEDVVRGKVHKSIHTRLPVIDDGTVVGYLHARIYLQARDVTDAPWESLVEPMIQVHRNENILDVFRKLQKKKQHLSAVVDEEERFIGIMSLEDMVEEIVGDIEEDVSTVKLMRLMSSRNYLRPHRRDQKS